MMTDEIRERLPAMGATDGDGFDAVAQVKFFTPWSNWTWWATEFDPEEGIFFGLVQGLEQEMGYFALAELQGIVGPGGLKIERDLYFKPTKLRDCEGVDVPDWAKGAS